MKTLLMCAYQGTSFPSRQICFWTRSKYSHVSLYFPDKNMEWEAWENGGCGWRIGLGLKHTPGTLVDIFAWRVSEADYERVLNYCNMHDGDEYDWPGIWGFVSRRKTEKEAKLFCSEAIVSIGMLTGNPVLRPPSASLVTPGQCTWSPVVHFRGTVIIGKHTDTLQHIIRGL